MDWRETRVAPGRTHHLIEDKPLYTVRFEEVLKFHAPGLAAARTEAGATHVDTSGTPVYAARYTRTFGFYEGRAAVDDGGRWFHVLPDGEALSALRHAWCGNFQGGRCAVRDPDGRYYHLDAGGRPAYCKRWRYAGDYRDGVAVVQRGDGLHLHIDAAGRPIHARAFLDLDVFHKRFARARDGDGWTHVDHAGHALYPRRFRMVEPFYNGQARVERFDGALEVIDESGEPLVELRSPRPDRPSAPFADPVPSHR